MKQFIVLFSYFAGYVLSSPIRTLNRFLSNVLQKSAPATIAAFALLNDPQYAFPVEKTRIFEEVWKNVNENFYDDKFNHHDWNQVKEDYFKKISNGGNDQALANSALQLLDDKYTRLVDKTRYEALWKFDAIGIGLLFQSDATGKDMVIASDPLSGSSGAKAGLMKDDHILSFNGISTKGQSALQVLDYMSVDESNTVTLEYTRPSVSSDVKIATLVRAREKAINPVTYSSEKISDGSTVGYIKLAEFNSASVRGFENALADLNKKNVDEIFIDLRGNLGGGFQFALNIGGMFMDNKVMVTAVGRNNEKNVFYTSYPPGVLFKKPIVILTDSLSASASEVLASGLHDNCRAVLAGEKTFGKGKIQAVFGLSDGEGMIMTVAQYVSPNGNIIQSRGIEPDIPLPTLNAYLSMVAPPGLTKPRLDLVDQNTIKQKLKLCESQSQSMVKSSISVSEAPVSVL